MLELGPQLHSCLASCHQHSLCLDMVQLLTQSLLDYRLSDQFKSRLQPANKCSVHTACFVQPVPVQCFLTPAGSTPVQDYLFICPHPEPQYISVNLLSALLVHQPRPQQLLIQRCVDLVFLVVLNVNVLLILWALFK